MAPDTHVISVARARLQQGIVQLLQYKVQRPGDGGLGFGTTVTSAIFLLVIVALVTYLTKTLKPEDLEPPRGAEAPLAA